VIDTQDGPARLIGNCHRIVRTLTPKGNTYLAEGEWNLLGLVSYGGAGGQNRTMVSVN
jgi:hypothetical protein